MLIILMSTYNGDKYIAELLDSLLEQSLSADKILIRDDGSQDKTVSIIEKYTQKHSSIELLQDNLGNLGSSKSFLVLLTAALKYHPDYILYADQDDLWLKDKIEITYKKFKEIVLKPNQPALVFTDVQLVDANLKLIHPSYEQFQHFNLNEKQFCLAAFLLYCPALGCTMMFNRALLEGYVAILQRAGDLKQYIIHDKWALILAAAVGQIGHLDTTTLLYRQHTHNVYGGQGGINRSLWSPKNLNFIQRRYQVILQELLALNQLLPGDSKNKRVLEEAIQLFTGSFWQRMKLYNKFSYFLPHWKRKLGLFVALFFKYKTTSLPDSMHLT